MLKYHQEGEIDSKKKTFTKRILLDLYYKS